MKRKTFLITLIIAGVSLSLFTFYKIYNKEKEKPILSQEKPIRPWGREIDEESLKNVKKIIEVEVININVEGEEVLKIKWGNKENEIGGKSEYLGSHGPGMWDGAEPPRILFITNDEEVILEDRERIKIFTKDGFKKVLNLDGFYTLEGLDNDGNFYLSKNGERGFVKVSKDGEVLFSFDPIKDIIEKYQLREPIDINAYNFTVLPNGNFYTTIEVAEKMEIKEPNPQDPSKTISKWQVYNQFKVNLLFDPNGNLIEEFSGYFETPINNLIDKNGYYYVTKQVPKEKSQSIKGDRVINQIERFLINNFEYKYLDSINIVGGKWVKSDLGFDFVEGDYICVSDINENGAFFIDRGRTDEECKKDFLKYMIFDKNKLYSFYLPIDLSPIEFFDNKIYGTFLTKDYYIIMSYKLLFP